MLVTNTARTGSTYDVLLVDESAHIVAEATARLPLLKQNQTVMTPLANGGAGGAYYLDGDTDIHALHADGTAPLVKTIAAGSSAALSFAVSPDGQRIAVSAITEPPNGDQSTGHGYIEDLNDGGGHVDIFRNTGEAAFRWPLAWYGTDIVDANGPYGCSASGSYGGVPVQRGDECEQSLHVIDATSQARVATMCETPTAPPSAYYNWQVDGLVTPAGIACSELEYPAVGSDTCTIEAVDLNGNHSVFSRSTCGSQTLTNCFLSPDGRRMACSLQNNGALVFAGSDGTTHNLGQRYTVLGWIDGSHLMVDVDASTLAVLDADSGAATALTFTNADKVEMEGVVPG